MAFTWAFSRIVGIPAIAVFWRLPVGVPDLAVTAAELVLLILLFRLRRERRSGPDDR